MRTRYHKRTIISYICTVGIVSILLTLYVWGLKQHKQTGVKFNLRYPKFKRDIYSKNAAHRSFAGSNSNKETRQARARVPIREGHDVKDDIQRLIGAGGRESWVRRYGTRGEGLVAVGQSKEKAAEEDRAIQDILDRLENNARNAVNNEKLGVYVVEEHHEVIPYWFSAANKGSILKTGNTLIHIDGHSDLAPPDIAGQQYPFFTWPSSKQLKYLMQANDVFILSAGMAGLFNRVIWVWPDWDLPNHGEPIDYFMTPIRLGYVMVGKDKTRAFCMCETIENGTECSTAADVGFGMDDEVEDRFIVPVDECVILKTLIVEEVHESSALVNFGKSDWIAKDESIILDIDEDFFGCSYAIRPLLNASLSMEQIERFNEFLRSNLCPKNITHEHETDDFLTKLISLIRKKKACSVDPTLKNSEVCNEVKDLDPVEVFGKKLEERVENEKMTMCSPKIANSLPTFTQNLVTRLSKLRIKQLRAFQTVGFCSTTSEKTPQFGKMDRYFGLCYGFNTPDESAVLEHNPTSEEISRRSVILKGILKKLGPRNPGVVTISRSVRDGYTPREYFDRIEKSILTSLNTTMGRPLHVHYDVDLLGGKRGWPAKHKV